MNISHVSGISPPVPLPCALADASDPHHVVTDYLDAMQHRHRSKAKYEELSDTLSACCLNCPRALREYWTVVCLSKSPHHSACSAYAGQLVPTDTNNNKKILRYVCVSLVTLVCCDFASMTIVYSSFLNIKHWLDFT